MNKRIRELAVESGAQTVTGLSFTDEALEKFAELIVKECINVGKSVHLDTAQEEYALEQLLEIIGNHFRDDKENT
jgi:hypothetical protein